MYASRLVLFILLIASIIPAAVTVDAPHATRSLFSIYLLLFLGLAGYQQLLFFKSNRYICQLYSMRKLFLIGIVVSQLVLSVIYVSHLKNDHRLQVADTMLPGLDQFLQAQSRAVALPIVVYDQTGYDYILFAWYGRIPAQLFFQTIDRLDKDSIGFSYGKTVGPYHFVSTIDKNQSSYVSFTKGQWQYVQK